MMLGSALHRSSPSPKRTGGWRYTRREYPSRSPNHLWYDLGISESGTTWVIPRFGGQHTEQILDGLASVAPPHTTLKWSASGASPADDEDS
jgi:hypothetical protein